MSCASPRYQVYVLRLWQEQAATFKRAAVWRFVLEDPKTRQRRGFDGLESLLAFLRAEIGETRSQAEPENKERTR